ncbi:MAG: hypothetical protein WB392_07270 [Methanotrichaceae archaeon]
MGRHQIWGRTIGFRLKLEDDKKFREKAIDEGLTVGALAQKLAVNGNFPPAIDNIIEDYATVKPLEVDLTMPEMESEPIDPVKNEEAYHNALKYLQSHNRTDNLTLEQLIFFGKLQDEDQKISVNGKKRKQKIKGRDSLLQEVDEYRREYNEVREHPATDPDMIMHNDICYQTNPDDRLAEDIEYRIKDAQIKRDHKNQEIALQANRKVINEIRGKILKMEADACYNSCGQPQWSYICTICGHGFDLLKLAPSCGICPVCGQKRHNLIRFDYAGKMEYVEDVINSR